MSNREPLDLKAIRALCDAATPGPFCPPAPMCPMDMGGPKFAALSADEQQAMIDSDETSWLLETQRTHGMTADFDRRADAEFFAAMRTAAPAMLDEIMRLGAELAAERRKVDRVRAHIELCEAWDGNTGPNVPGPLYAAGYVAAVKHHAKTFRAALADESEAT